MIKKGALLVPQRAVSELQGSYQVAVVDKANKVAIRLVTVGERFENFWIIEKGLKPGEQVVAEGLQKVKPGMTVTSRPFQADGVPGKDGFPQKPSGNEPLPRTRPDSRETGGK
jgi:membrane fusion protein (multidrug efflux system)